MSDDATHDKGSLRCMFEPRSVAIIGASDDAGRIGGRPVRYLKAGNFAGAIYPVNPNREMVQGLKAYPDIASVPGDVDLAIIALPAAHVAGAIAACGARGVKALVVFSAGFGEVDAEGAAAQAKLRDAARSAGMRMLGPNCLGVFNAQRGMFATFSNALNNRLPQPGSFAIASQSGAVGAHLAYLCADRGIGTDYWITTGNEADIDIAEVLLYLADAPGVKAILVYVEAVRDGDTFVRALELARRNARPVIVLKVGRSSIGAKAAASHTGALAGEDAIYDAVFRQYGAIRAQSFEQAMDLAYACHAGIYPDSRSIGLVTGSGGVGIQMADGAERVGLDVSPMPAAAQAAIKALVPYASPVNPVDMTGQVVNDPSLFERCLALTIEQGGYATIMVFLASGPATPSVREWLMGALVTLKAQHPGRLIVLCMTAPIEAVRAFEQAGFLVFEDSDRALLAIGALCHFGAGFAQREATRPQDAPAPVAALPAEIDEHIAKRILGAAGISSWPEKMVRSVHEVGIAAGEFAGGQFAGDLALKIVSPDILHKSEVGGVALSIAPAAAADRASAMLDRLATSAPTARIEGFLVSPMCVGGIETICGTVRDPVFGPMIMFGLGGILVEVLGDVSFRRAPVDAHEARRMIDDIQGRSILDGVRGAPPVDVAALTEVLVRLSEFAFAHRDEVVEIDINPLRVMEVGAVALDALITRG